MDDTYTKALKRREELQQELKTLSDFITLHDVARKLLSDRSPMDSDTKQEQICPEQRGSEVAAPAPESPPQKPKRVTDNPKPAVVVDAAVSILHAHGRPMTRRDLHRALAGRGLLVRGADPIKALGTMLWRGRDKLEQIEGLGYWIKGQPYGAADDGSELNLLRVDLRPPELLGEQ